MSEMLPSIRGRLSKALVLYSLLWTITVSGAVSFVVRHEVDEIMDATLREASQILHGLLSFNLQQLPIGAGGTMPAPPHKEELIWQIVDPQHGVVLRSHEAPAAPLVPVSTLGLADVADAWRVHVSPFGAQGRVLMVAQPALERREAQLEAIEYSVGAALVVGLLCSLWLRRGVRRELQPMADLSAAVQAFDPLQRTTPFPRAQRQELQPVHVAIADLGQRLAHRVASERAFSAHAAHALRTPLAGMVAQLATAQRLCPESAQPMLGKARQAADRLRRVVTALLALFRTGSEVQWQPVVLAELAEGLGDGAISVRTEGHEPLLADPDLLSAALANLLDNSVRHGAHTAVLRLERDGAMQRILLTDDGPGMSEAQRLSLQRALSSQSYEGQTGLGLMLADLVARAHGGRLTLLPADAGCSVCLSVAQPSRNGDT